jgi:hypothetical protein
MDLVYYVTYWPIPGRIRYSYSGISPGWTGATVTVPGLVVWNWRYRIERSDPGHEPRLHWPQPNRRDL